MDELLELLTDWYANYRFSKKATTTLFNTDMVLYFVKQLFDSSKFPDDMIDENSRIYYGKLRHLLGLDQGLNGNFNRLSEIVATGKITSTVVKGFLVGDLTKSENFTSLLYYFGLLSHAKNNQLIIPNRAIKKLMYGYFREAMTM